MKYELNDIPHISDLYGYQNDQINNRVICSADGHIKVLNCILEILEDVLSCINGVNTFSDIESQFIDKYSVDEVRLFLEELLKEGIIEIQLDSKQLCKHPNILVIGEGAIAENFKGYTSVTVDSFMSKDLDCDFDIAILAPSKITYSKLFCINKKLLKCRKTFIQMSFNGEKISVGPLVIPNKSACLECGTSYELKRLNSKLNSEEKIDINDLKELNYCCNYPKKSNQIQINNIINILCNDVVNFFNNHGSAFLDRQYFFDLNTFDFQKEERLATTYCDCCNAFNTNYIKFDPKTMNCETLLTYDVNTTVLNERDIKYQVGGLRSKSENETKELLYADLKKLGANVKIEPAFGNPFNDNNTINCFNAHVEQTNIREIPYLFRRTHSAGKGLTKSQSFFSAAFELLEHMSLQYTGEIPMICAKYSDVDKIAIDMPYLASTIKNKNTAFDDFDENKEIDWIVATSLTDGSKKLVPAFLVFMQDVQLKGKLFGTTSSGAGAGTTLEDAILHGLFEAIERDAWLIGQCNPYVLPIVDYTSSKNPRIKEIIKRIKQMGYEVITRDYTNDLSIPVYRTWIYNKNNYSKYAYMGLGCHISPEIALERSITEVVQIDDWSSTGGEIDSDMITIPVLSNSLINLYNQHFLVNKDILGKTDKITMIGEPMFEMHSTYGIIKKLTKLIKEKVQGDVYYIDLTKVGMNVKVVRTIITGDFQNMNIPLLSASKRMFEFGIRCGYSDKKTIYEELYMGKYQH